MITEEIMRIVLRYTNKKCREVRRTLSTPTYTLSIYSYSYPLMNSWWGIEAEFQVELTCRQNQESMD